MAGTIQLLSEEVIGKIAAGEVVERPSAAIKELVENSLDAGATAVTVEIRDGGITYFRVTDNGSGIRAEDIRMAFERHATSKIRRTNDLFSISTLGFRGEALASIASVSKVTCTTRTRQDVSGLKVQNNGGHIEKMEEAACPEGTTFVVRDLFFNTPVRLKFLKKPVTEAGYVSDLMMRLILSRPDVSFRYVSQGKMLYHSAGDGKLASAVFSIYGREMLSSMREVSGNASGVVVKGFVGVGESGRGSRAHQSFFINGRYMRSNVLSAAVEEACRERLIAGKYPTCVLHLTMPYDSVDVNVHPNKLEVRFQNEQGVAEAVENAVADALRESSVLEKVETMRMTPAPENKSVPVVVQRTETYKTDQKSAIHSTPEKNAVSASPAAKAIPEPQDHADKDTVVNQDMGLPADTQISRATKQTKSLYTLCSPNTVAASYASSVRPMPPTMVRPTLQQATAIPPKPQPNLTEQSFLPELPKTIRQIGTVFDSYILVEYEHNLLLIDQQGVHERLLFDRMMKALDQHHCGQEMLVPLILSVTRREQEMLQEHHEMLSTIGLTVEPFGDTEVSVRTIPMILGQPQAADFLREILDQLESERGSISLEKRRMAILAIACRKSVKAGEKLNEADLHELVSRVVDRNIFPTSPRGTPLVIALAKTDIDRRFRRLQ